LRLGQIGIECVFTASKVAPNNPTLHSHRTAEVFFVLKGRWRFFWGRWGDAGEVVLEEGDIFNIPTGIFRGFENIGTD